MTLTLDLSLSWAGAVLASLHELAVLGDLLRPAMSLELTELLRGESGTSGLLVACRSRLPAFPLLEPCKQTANTIIILVLVDYERFFVRRVVNASSL